jgi:serpin B
MMNQTARFPYFDGGTFQALELPYKGCNMAMIVLLPKRFDGLAELEGSLAVEKLESWQSKLDPRRVKVCLPKFSLTAEFELKDALSALGMPLAFQPGKADFSGITGTRDFFLSVVVHKAFVEVEEKGTEAAAATAAIGVRASLSIEPEPIFRADHPFLYLIRDTRTGTILFLGRLSRP